MIILLGASALILAALQASIAAPTKDFRGCLHDAASKATSEKVAANAIEDYLRSACTAQMGSLKDALVQFRMKNGMGKKAAADDAQMTIDDYLATPADNYRFAAEQNTPKPTPAAAPATPPPAHASSQPQGH
jgi:hypothetical protein